MKSLLSIKPPKKLRKSCFKLENKPKQCSGYVSEHLWKGSKAKRVLISKKYPVKTERF